MHSCFCLLALPYASHDGLSKSGVRVRVGLESSTVGAIKLLNKFETATHLKNYVTVPLIKVDG